MHFKGYFHFFAVFFREIELASGSNHAVQVLLDSLDKASSVQNARRKLESRLLELSYEEKKNIFYVLEKGSELDLVSKFSKLVEWLKGLKSKAKNLLKMTESELKNEKFSRIEAYAAYFIGGATVMESAQNCVKPCNDLVKEFGNNSLARAILLLHLSNNEELFGKIFFEVKGLHSDFLKDLGQIGPKELYIAIKNRQSAFTYFSDVMISSSDLKKFLSILPTKFFIAISRLNDGSTKIENMINANKFLDFLDNLDQDDIDSVLNYLVQVSWSYDNYGIATVVEIAEDHSDEIQILLKKFAERPYRRYFSDLGIVLHEFSVFRAFAQGFTTNEILEALRRLVEPNLEKGISDWKNEFLRRTENEIPQTEIDDGKVFRAGVVLLHKITNLASKFENGDADSLYDEIEKKVKRSAFSKQIAMFSLSTFPKTFRKVFNIGNDVTRNLEFISAKAKSVDEFFSALTMFHEKFDEFAVDNIPLFLEWNPCIRAAQMFKNLAQVGNLVEFSEGLKSDKSTIYACALERKEEMKTRSQFISALKQLDEKSSFPIALEYAERVGKGVLDFTKIGIDLSGNNLAKFVLANGPVRAGTNDFADNYFSLYDALSTNDHLGILEMAKSNVSKDRVEACLQTNWITSGNSFKTDATCKKLRSFVHDNFFGAIALLRSGIPCADIYSVISTWAGSWFHTSEKEQFLGIDITVDTNIDGMQVGGVYRKGTCHALQQKPDLQLIQRFSLESKSRNTVYESMMMRTGIEHHNAI